jgi:hypothetical protein
LYALAVDWQRRVLYVSTSSPGNGIYKLYFWGQMIKMILIHAQDYRQDNRFIKALFNLYQMIVLAQSLTLRKKTNSLCSRRVLTWLEKKFINFKQRENKPFDF